MEKLSAKNKFKNEAGKILDEGANIYNKFLKKEENFRFNIEYQEWYSKALKIVEVCANDRYQEFRNYYEIDPKRKTLNYGTYVIQDYFKGIVPSMYSSFDDHGRVLVCLMNQYTIFNSIFSRIDNIVSNIETELFFEVQDNELTTAKSLVKISPRAGGALAGVIMETHLQKVIKNHSIPITKKSPTISEMNEPLKNSGIIDLITWRKIGVLADLRNLCSHKKEREPTKEEALELIDGVNWLIKTVN